MLIALLLGCGPTGDPMEGLDFDGLPSAFPAANALESYPARDGAALPLRVYGSGAPVALVLFHGSGAESRYLSDLARPIADAGVADVYTPDLRGHGREPERRGDIDYIDQLEDDAADLVRFVRARSEGVPVVLGGHSSGGGLAIRLAGSGAADPIDGYLLLAPFLQHDAPTTRPASGGWAHPKLERIVALTLLNQLGITALNGTPVLEFALPEARRTGHETPSYSYRLMTGFAPRSYRTDLAALDAPTLVLVGDEDEAFHAERFAPVFAEFAPHARVETIPGASHLGLVGSAAARTSVVAWLRDRAEASAGARR